MLGIYSNDGSSLNLHGTKMGFHGKSINLMTSGSATTAAFGHWEASACAVMEAESQPSESGRGFLKLKVVDEKEATPKSGATKTLKKPSANAGKKWRRLRKESYSTYTYKVMKQVQPDTSISSEAMSIISFFVNNAVERITGETSRLAHYNKRSTISSQEIQTVMCLLLPRELAKLAMSEGTEAATMNTTPSKTPERTEKHPRLVTFQCDNSCRQ
ncbi:histone H2B 1/2-like [Carcharodon carcharias]|uniref:histone H2B 1/2-like n=1 Tax=Carcharodon carcharias TaxID=13397 RepID=UPI001B7F1DCF|nr:histone H2B 1/2-like [Carcharodon carcharias]